MDSGVEIWSSTGWRERATSWVDEQLATAKITRTGEIAQTRVRPWSTILKIPTAQGTVWFKAASPATSFEIKLYELLQRTAEAYVLAALAIDVERGWILLPDGGPSLGELYQGHELANMMATALPQYAELQRNLSPHTTELLTFGVVDMRPHVMPERYEQALEAISEYVHRQDDSTAESTYKRLLKLRPTFATWCEKLSAAPGQASLDHNDLHPWNIFVTGSPSDIRAKFYDWGDSVIAHSFACMLVPLEFIQRELNSNLEASEFLRVRDAYLEVFTDTAPHAELVETLKLACHVAKVARALVWQRALLTHGNAPAQFENAPFSTLSTLLDNSYLGDA